MTKASLAIDRYEPVENYGEVSGASMIEDPSGDWVRYAYAARIQRARARNLVGRLRYKAEQLTANRWFERHMRNHRWADRIAAKYLGEGT